MAQLMRSDVTAQAGAVRGDQDQTRPPERVNPTVGGNDRMNTSRASDVGLPQRR